MTQLEALRHHFLADVYRDFRNLAIINPKLKISTRDAGSTVKRVIFHCTDSEGWSPERLASFFVYERGFPICAYHYYVTDNAVYHIVGENIITYHAAPHNSDTVAFSIGYYATRDDKLNVKIKPSLYENALQTAAFLCIKFHILPKNLFGHRELHFTGWYKDKNDNIVLRKTCPGLAIDLDQFRYQVGRRIQMALNTLYKADLVIDGIIGPKTISAYKLIPKF